MFCPPFEFSHKGCFVLCTMRPTEVLKQEDHVKECRSCLCLVSPSGLSRLFLFQHKLKMVLEIRLIITPFQSFTIVQWTATVPIISVKQQQTEGLRLWRGKVSAFKSSQLARDETINVNFSTDQL